MMLGFLVLSFEWHFGRQWIRKIKKSDGANVFLTSRSPCLGSKSCTIVFLVYQKVPANKLSICSYWSWTVCHLRKCLQFLKRSLQQITLMTWIRAGHKWTAFDAREYCDLVSCTGLLLLIIETMLMKGLVTLLLHLNSWFLLCLTARLGGKDQTLFMLRKPVHTFAAKSCGTHPWLQEKECATSQSKNKWRLCLFLIQILYFSLHFRDFMFLWETSSPTPVQGRLGKRFCSSVCFVTCFVSCDGACCSLKWTACGKEIEKGTWFVA